MKKLPDNTIQAQRMINTGDAWRMEGSWGRATMRAIEAGSLMLGPKPVRDFYGSIVPARGDVQPGTKGSTGYVAKLFGDDYAKALEEIE